MKTLKILLVLVAVILSGFAKDSQRTEAGVVKPMKIWGSTIPNAAEGYTVCTPVGAGIAHSRFGWMQGHQTHGGKLIPEESPWEITDCSTNFTSGLNISNIKGVVTVANGDSYSYSCIMTVNIYDNGVTFDVTVTNGVGMFKGVTGQMMLTGSYYPDVHVVTFSGDGFLTFPK